MPEAQLTSLIPQEKVLPLVQQVPLGSFSKCQQEYLLFLVLGTPCGEAMRALGIKWRQVYDWKRKRPGFSEAVGQAELLAGDIGYQKEAQQLLLMPYGPVVLKHVAEMATKNWEDLENRSEYTAKMRCMEIVTGALGISGSQGVKAPSWNVLIQQKIEEVNVSAKG